MNYSKSFSKFLRNTIGELCPPFGFSMTFHGLGWHKPVFSFLPMALSSCFRVFVFVLGWRVPLCIYFFCSFYCFRTCRVGHLDFVHIFISHILNFSSKFCDVFCWTLHPSRVVVCRPRQTRVDVHILVAVIQWYCWDIFRNPNITVPKVG